VGTSVLKSKYQAICFAGRTPLLPGLKTPREVMVSSAGIPVPLIIQPDYLYIASRTKSSLHLWNESYTVIHFGHLRAGITEDMMIKQIETYAYQNALPNQTVYLATVNGNLPISASKLASMNIRTWEDLRWKSELSLIDLELIEMDLMIDATSFYGWGTGELHDVIEFERFRRRKSYCLGHGGNFVAHRQDYSYCKKHKNDMWAPIEHIEKINSTQFTDDELAEDTILRSLFRMKMDNPTAKRRVDAEKQIHSAPGPKGRYFVWYPSASGLFSQFVQLKLFYEANNNYFNRTIFVMPLTSAHYDNVSVSFCDLFELPHAISCPRVDDPRLNFTLTYRLRSFGSKLLEARTPGIVWNGRVPFFPRTHNIRDVIVRSVDLSMRLRLTPAKLELFEKCKAALGILPDMTYTVVHWRRGDQLETRCAMRLDLSVNCEDAMGLIKRVREFSRDKIVFVATNEKPSSPELDVLEENGFKIFRSTNIDLPLIDILMVETALMVDATTFLAWGVSEVNDVVEFERRENGQSWCKSGDLNEGGDLTWCRLQHMKAEALKSTLPAGEETPSANRLYNSVGSMFSSSLQHGK
jgi:hypothetical protein